MERSLSLVGGRQSLPARNISLPRAGPKIRLMRVCVGGRLCACFIAVSPVCIAQRAVRVGSIAAGHHFRNDSWWNGADTESGFGLRIALVAQQKAVG
jgi:hypothetical protein